MMAGLIEFIMLIRLIEFPEFKGLPAAGSFTRAPKRPGPGFGVAMQQFRFDTNPEP